MVAADPSYYVAGRTDVVYVTVASAGATTSISTWFDASQSSGVESGDDLVEAGPACARAGCRREADTRGLYGGRMSGLCQLHKAMSDRRLRSGRRW